MSTQTTDVAGQDAPAAVSRNAAPLILTGTAGDSDRFGTAIAMTDSAVYVGDPDRNRVVVYGKTGAGDWIRQSQISGPADSQGFGYALAVGGDRLAIGAYAQVTGANGAVFSYSQQQGLVRIAATDATHIVGFSVAASPAAIAYGRRRQNDPAQQSGSVVVMTGGQQTVYALDDAPDYFGATLHLDGNRLFALAPAIGPHGGAALFDITVGPQSAQRFVVPAGLGRAQSANALSIASGACVISGAGRADGGASVAWDGCDTGRFYVIGATGPVAQSGSTIAFADAQAVPQFGQTGPFAVSIFSGNRTTAPTRILNTGGIATSLRRNVALSGTQRAIVMVPAAGPPQLLIE